MSEETVEETKTSKEQKGSAPSQDPVEVELQKEKDKVHRSEAEKVAFNLRKKADEAKKLGLDPKEVLGLTEEEKDASTDEVPDWYKREKAKETQKTALEMADSIQDAAQRELVKTYIQNRIVPSGNPEDDFRFALAATSAVKNGQVAQMLASKGTPKVTAAGGSQSAHSDAPFEPTEEESRLMQPPYNLSKEKILAARAKAQK